MSNSYKHTVILEVREIPGMIPPMWGVFSKGEDEFRKYDLLIFYDPDPIKCNQFAENIKNNMSNVYKIYISYKYKVYYINLPKCASTRILRAIEWKHFIENEPGTAIPPLPSPDWRYFTCIREPFTRLQSGYAELVKRGMTDLPFNDFVSEIDKFIDDPHIRPYYPILERFLHEPGIKLTVLFCDAALDACLNEFLKDEIHPERVNARKNRVNVAYSLSSIDKVNEVYKKDLLFFYYANGQLSKLPTELILT